MTTWMLARTDFTPVHITTAIIHYQEFHVKCLSDLGTLFVNQTSTIIIHLKHSYALFVA